MTERIDDTTADATAWGPTLDAQELLGALLASEARLRDQASILEMVAKGMPLDETLTEICRVVEAHIPGASCDVVVSGQSFLPDVLRHDGIPEDSHWSVPIPAFTDGRLLGTLEI